MSKKIYGAAIVAMCITSSAQAADMAYRQPQAPYAPPPLAYTWAGPYIGGNIGYGWGDITNNPASPSGVLGGAQIGYNWQSGAWVFGIEGDIQANSADDTFAPWKFSNPWFGTARGRAGYALNNVLFYGTAGIAFGSVTAELSGLSETHSSVGWTAGVGVEFALNQNWSAKGEFLYVDLASQTFSITGLPNGYQFGVVRLGVNYHF